MAFASDELLASEIDAADLAVLPFRRITNSGTVHTALNSGLPVIIPDLSDLDHVPPECAIRFETGSIESLREALVHALSLADSDMDAMADAARRFADGGATWEQSAEAVVRAVKEIPW